MDYSLNSVKDGSSTSHMSYDDAIDYLEYDLVKYIRFTVRQDKDRGLENVWWVYLEDDREPSYMITSCERAFNIQQER